jgi:hypothetical protein
MNKMHTSFTFYHTVIISLVSLTGIVLLSKILNINLRVVFPASVLLILLVVALFITLAAALYTSQSHSGMYRVKSFGFPRWFYQIRTETGGLSTKLILYRYFIENLVVWFCFCSFIYFLFKMLFINKK